MASATAFNRNDFASPANWLTSLLFIYCFFQSVSSGPARTVHSTERSGLISPIAAVAAMEQKSTTRRGSRWGCQQWKNTEAPKSQAPTKGP